MLRGRIALVTNVEHFVGLPAAVELAAQGAWVLCHDKSFTQSAAALAFAERYPELLVSQCQDPAELVAAAVTAHGRLDIVVSNDAFPAIRAAVDQARLEDLRGGLEEMVVAPFALAQAAAPQLKQQRAGKLLFVTSAAPFHGLANYSMYVAARAATNALARSLALELAPFEIQVNAVAPNFVESPTYFPPALMDDPETRRKILKNIPLGRLGRPDEAAALIAFLASDRSDFITGHVMPFAGGWA